MRMQHKKACAQAPLRVGEWEVEPELLLARRGKRSFRLRPKSMEVLVYLASRPSKVASRESILNAVWGGAFVSDDVLTQAVRDLRRVLGDSASSPRVIETIPKRGYRVIAPVSKMTVPTEGSTMSLGRSRGWKFAGFALTHLVAVGIGYLVASAPTFL